MIMTKAEKEKQRKFLEKELDKEEKKQQAEGEAKLARAKRWKKKESKSNPGNFYYLDTETGETHVEKPADFMEEKVVWARVESKSNRGQFYYHNDETGENRVERPVGVEVLNDV